MVTAIIEVQLKLLQIVFLYLSTLLSFSKLIQNFARRRPIIYCYKKCIKRSIQFGGRKQSNKLDFHYLYSYILVGLEITSVWWFSLMNQKRYQWFVKF